MKKTKKCMFFVILIGLLAMTATVFAAEVSIEDLRAHDNIALYTTGARPIAINTMSPRYTHYLNDGDVPPPNVGDPQRRWSSHDVTLQEHLGAAWMSGHRNVWFGIDFGEVRTFNAIVVTDAGRANAQVADFVVEIATTLAEDPDQNMSLDAAGWETIYTGNGIGIVGNEGVIVLPSDVSARYVRVRSTTVTIQNQWPPTITEFEVYHATFPDRSADLAARIASMQGMASEIERMYAGFAAEFNAALSTAQDAVANGDNVRVLSALRGTDAPYSVANAFPANRDRLVARVDYMVRNFGDDADRLLGGGATAAAVNAYIAALESAQTALAEGNPLDVEDMYSRTHGPVTLLRTQLEMAGVGFVPEPVADVIGGASAEVQGNDGVSGFSGRVIGGLAVGGVMVGVGVVLVMKKAE